MYSQESFVSCPSPSRAGHGLTPPAEYTRRELVNNTGRKIPPSQSSPSLHENSLYQDEPLGVPFKDSVVRVFPNQNDTNLLKFLLLAIA